MYFEDIVRVQVRAVFQSEMSEGLRTPLVLPYALLGPFIVPTVYLAIPHTQRPWLYRARWLVMAYVVVFCLRLGFQASSPNFAFSYATGLMAGWGIISTANLLLWSKPQFEAARIIRSKKPQRGTSSANGRTTAMHTLGQLTQRERSGHLSKREDSSTATETIELPHASETESNFMWQPFPETAPLLTRLNWALDLTTNFRGTGWNWADSRIPHPRASPKPPAGSPVDFKTVPRVAQYGCYICTSRRELVISRLRLMGMAYIGLDILFGLMMRDPWFILGPDIIHTSSLQQDLVHPYLLLIAREIMSLSAFIGALFGMFSLNDLVQYFCAESILPCRSELWHYPSSWGDFSHVLDRGILGWWGVWWHQTFRLQFMAPAKYLLRQGYVQKGTAANTLTLLGGSFLQSAFLHAMGSVSTMPPTKPWRPVAFFLLQIPGVVLQNGIAYIFRKHVTSPSKPVVRVLNLAFTLLWLQLTARFFVDDIASGGIWLVEPVPVSFVRLLGFGRPGEHWWRWTGEHLPKWHWDDHWWRRGLAM